MLSRFHRAFRWLMLVGSGAFLFQGAACGPLELLQTGFLGFIAGAMYFLVRNV
jgi:hypothetical protein